MKTYTKHYRPETPIQVVWAMILKRKILVISTFVILFFLPIAYLTTRYQSKTEAAWLDDHWGYRQTVAITNSGAAQTDFQVSVTVDTATLITAGKMQSDCDDIRITDVNGKILAHWIETGTNACNTATTKIWTRIPSLPTSGATVFLYYGNPSSVSNRNSSVLATSCSGINAYLGSGLYFIDPDGSNSTTPFQAYCDMTTDSGGWTLVASWNTAQEWTKTSTSTSNVFGTTALDAVSSNFGNASITDYRILASDAVTTTGSSAYADWYYHYNTAIMWKEVWAPTSNTGGHVGDGYQSTTPRQALKPFNYSYNIKFAYQVTQTYNNIADWGYTGAATSGCLPNYWTTLTTAGNPFGVYSTNSYTGSDGANCGGGVNDGSLALCPSDQANCIPGQDMSVQNAKIGYDDGAAWAKFGGTATTNVGGTAGVDATTKLWWFIRSSTPINNNFTVAAPTNEQKSLGPVAYWKFDEGYGGNVYDSTSNSNTGTITAATWQTENQCISGKCLYFDGSGDYVTNNKAISFGTGNFTVSFWMRMGGTTGNYALFDEGAPGNSTVPGYQMFISNTSLRYNISNGSGNWEEVVVSNTSGINDNKWHYVTWTYNAAQNQFYVDGILKMQRNWTYGSGNPTANFKIATSWTQSPFGFMDDFKVYNYARTAAQIKSDFASKGSGSVKGTSASLGSSAKNSDAFSNGLVGYWKMDEAAANSCTGGVNDSCDSSGNASDGAWNGTTIGPTTGKYGNSVDFGGTNEYINVSDNDNLDASGNLTIAAWIKLDTLTHNSHIVSKNLYQSSSYTFFIDSGGHLYVNTKNQSGTSILADSTTTVSTGSWYYVTAVIKPTEKIYLYLNGQEVSYNRQWSFSPGDILSNSQPLLISDNGSSQTVDGKIDEVRIYNRALSTREVRDLYNWAPGPLAYYNFEEGSGVNTYDSSSNGNIGTATNANIVNGKFGKARTFTGASNSKVEASVTNLPLGNNAKTISAWFKTSNTTARHRSIAAYGTGVSGKPIFLLDVNASHKLYTESGSGADAISSTASVNDNKWHFGSITHDGITLKLYLDGVLQGSSNCTLATATSNFGIGEMIWDTSLNFIGDIDEVRLYNYARSSKQIVEDMNAGHPVGGSPVGSQYLYYKFDEGYGSKTPSTVWNQAGTTTNLILNPSAEVDTSNTALWNSGTSNNVLSRDSTQKNFGSYSFKNTFTFASGLSRQQWTPGTISISPSTTYSLSTWHYISSYSVNASITVCIESGTNPWGGQTTTCSSELATASNLGRWIKITIKHTTASNHALLTAWTQFNSANSVAYVDGNQLEQISASTPYCDGSLTGNGTHSWSGTAHASTSTCTYGQDGEINGSTWTNTGKFGKALNFNGTNNNYVKSAPQTSFPTLISFSGWINPTSAAASSYIFNPVGGHQGGGSTPDSQVQFYMNTNKTLSANIWTNTPGSQWETAITTTTTVPLGQWSYVAYTFDGSKQKIYVNGSLAAQTSGTTTGTTMSDSGSQRVYVVGAAGENDGFTSPFTGQIDEVKVYSSALTEDEIKLDYNRGSAMVLGSTKSGDIVRDGLVLYLDANNSSSYNGSGTTWNDVSGQSFQATMRNLTSANWVTVDGIKAFETNDTDNQGFSVASWNQTTARTWEIWIKQKSTGIGWQTWMDNNSTERILFGSPNTSWYVYPDFNTGGVTANQWAQFAFTMDDNKSVRMFKNGVLVSAPGVYTNTLTLGSQTLYLLGDPGTEISSAYTGIIRAYNRKLADEEVKKNFDEDAPTFGLAAGSGTDDGRLGDRPPVAEWKMDEKTGANAYDTSGNGNTCTLVGSANFSTGKIGAALNMSSSSDYATCGTSFNPSQPITLEGWVYMNSLSTNNIIAGKDGTWTWYIRNSGGTQLSMYGTSEVWAAYTTFTAGTWYFVTTTIDSSNNVKHYVNGQLIANTNGSTTTLTPNANAFTIAKWSAGDRLNGKIDNLKIFDYARTPAQIAYDYNRGAPVGHWKMDECQGGSANDSSGNGNTGTITIGATGSQTAVGTCTTSGTAWYNGVTGKMNSSLNFDGTDDYVTITDPGTNSTIDLADRVSLSVWVKLASTDGNEHIIINKGIGAYMVKLYSNGYPGLGAYGVVNLTRCSKAISDTTTWHHIVNTKDGASKYVYLDGVDCTTSQGTGTLVDTNTNLFIGGANTNPDYPFNGQIDDVRIYNYALTPVQIKSVFNQGSGIRFGPSTGSP